MDSLKIKKELELVSVPHFFTEFFDDFFVDVTYTDQKSEKPSRLVFHLTED